MSRIYFHSEDETAEVRGSECAHLGVTCSRITWSVFKSVAEDWGERKALLRKLFPPGHYVLECDGFTEAARIYLSVGQGPLILGGKEINLFSLRLNTAHYMGSNPVRLAARLHGQCEIHAYVEGPNRGWLASIIREGREFKFFRDDMGWESVVALLESDDATPVVTSYSVCESFPNAGIAKFDCPILADGELDWDAWYEVSRAERWAMAMAGLRSSGGGLEMKPETWDDYCFGDGLGANEVVSQLVSLS